MTPLKKYRYLRFIKYSSILLLGFFILSMPLSFFNLDILPSIINNVFTMGFTILKKIGWIPSVIMLIIFWLLFTKLDQLLAGYKGEALGQKKLKKLKKYGYKVFANMKLRHNDDKSEMDFIVVGNNGIFIIEVKNIKGIITGHINDEHLTQIKKTKYNTYENKFYNPVKQVNTHVYKLSKYLKDNSINYWIQGYVYFPEKHSTIQVKDSNVIFSKMGGPSLLKHIQNYEGNHKINKNAQETITKLVNKYAVKI